MPIYTRKHNLEYAKKIQFTNFEKLADKGTTRVVPGYKYITNYKRRWPVHTEVEGLESRLLSGNANFVAILTFIAVFHSPE